MLDSEYLVYFLRSKKARNKLIYSSGATTISNISQKVLSEFLFPLPPFEEQKAIAQRLKTVDDQIENLRNQKEVLQKIKKKFMDLLLTGKVRVREV